MSAGTRTALVVVDLQYDFCTGPAVAARYHGDLTALDAATGNAALAVDAARNNGTEVIFVRFLGDVEYQGPSWRQRDTSLGKEPKCRAGTVGAEFYRVTPTPDERVFTKLACFDAFLAEGFEDHLIAGGIGHLVFAGLYSDVCVDSTARTAFQQGRFVTVLADCTKSLHLADADILRFMGAVYGARITTLDRADLWSAPRGGEDTWIAVPTQLPTPQPTTEWKPVSG